MTPEEITSLVGSSHAIAERPMNESPPRSTWRFKATETLMQKEDGTPFVHELGERFDSAESQAWGPHNIIRWLSSEASLLELAKGEAWNVFDRKGFEKLTGKGTSHSGG